MTGGESDIIVVDTNVISYLFKGDSRGKLYKRRIEGRLTMIAAQTFAEPELMPLNNNWGSNRHTALPTYLRKFVFVEANETASLLWAQIRARARKSGRPVSIGDTWLAATALAYDAPLVTHNPDDFRNVPGLTVFTEK